MRADASLGPGTFLAYLLPDPEILDLQYGPVAKLIYRVFVPSQTGTKRFELSELASLNYTVNAKLMRRIAAINNVTITEQTALSELGTQGFLLLELEQEKGTAFLKIVNGMPVPRGYRIPDDVRYDPTAPTTDFANVRADANVETDEPPF
jgi:hypothetical protein